MARAHPRSVRACVVLATALLGSAGFASAQDVTEPALKALFIYNFAKFTEWPSAAVAAAEPLNLCVVGDQAVGEALEKAVKGRALAGHQLNVAQVAQVGPAQSCHVLYVSGVTVGRAAQVIEKLRDGPVLTISDLEGFTDRGGIAECFFVDGRLRFKVHSPSAERARLKISSRLMLLAGIR
jgi:uncharacterized protein DUF4154